MKLPTLKIGQLIITPKMLFSIAFAFFIVGLGIGATVASNGNSLIALLFCSIISVFIIIYTFFKMK